SFYTCGASLLNPTRAFGPKFLDPFYTTWSLLPAQQHLNVVSGSVQHYVASVPSNMETFVQNMKLVPAQNMRQGRLDIGIVLLVKRPLIGKTRLAPVGTVETAAGDPKAKEWGKRLLQDRAAARQWFMSRNQDVLETAIKPTNLESEWSWPPSGSDADNNEKQVAPGVKHLLTYGSKQSLQKKEHKTKECMYVFARLRPIHVLRMADRSACFLHMCTGQVIVDSLASVAAAEGSADLGKVADLRGHLLEFGFTDTMKNNWSIRLDTGDMEVAMDSLEIRPDAGDELRFCVVTEVVCVSYILSDKTRHGMLGALVAASPVGLSGEFERSNTNEVSGATILLGFNALQFTATYPGDSKRHEAVKIDMWKKPAPTNSRVNYSASQAGPRLCAQDSGAALSEASGMDFSQTGASWGRSGCMLTDDLSGITDMELCLGDEPGGERAEKDVTA
ncbi:hypothetical protein COO60DRAFT_1684553, partial [Scenedesmus sp. NREL 46B-D3]